MRPPSRERRQESRPDVTHLRPPALDEEPGVRTKPQVHRESALEEPGRLWVPEEPGQESLDDELELEGAQGDLALGGELPQVRFQRSLERWRGSEPSCHGIPCLANSNSRLDPILEYPLEAVETRVLGNSFDELTSSHQATGQGISNGLLELVFVDRAGRDIAERPERSRHPKPRPLFHIHRAKN